MSDDFLSTLLIVGLLVAVVWWLWQGVKGVLLLFAKGYFACGCILWLLLGWQVLTIAVLLGLITLAIANALPPTSE
jgi:hypothetical protein